jgi:hypothetical protein
MRLRATMPLVGACAMLGWASAWALPLDALPGTGPWAPIASDDVVVHTSVGEGGTLSMAWDYQHHSGYAGAARAQIIDWPENFELAIPLKGDVAGNVLELKFADASNDNVWWARAAHLSIPPEGRVLRVRRREVSFAWGPAKDHTLSHTVRLELVVTARSGASGSLEVGPIELIPKPVAPALPPMAQVRTESGVTGLPDGTGASLPVAAPVVIDWGAPREIGGVRLEWKDGQPHAGDLESSADGEHYTPLVHYAGRGRVDWVGFAATEDRYWRLKPDAAPGPQALVSVTPQAADFGEDPNRRLIAIARERPAGEYPRGFLAQTAWTVVGVPGGGDDSALLSEDGAFEVGVGAPSVDAFVSVDGTTRWDASASTSVALAGGDLPLPQVTRQHGPISLSIEALSQGRGEATHHVVIYTLRNTDGHAHRADLDLALRPFQVNPPAQFLNVTGGFSPIRAIAWDGTRLIPITARGTLTLTPSVRPDGVGLGELDGSVPAGLPAVWMSAVDSAHYGRNGLESGDLRFTRILAAHSSVQIAICVDRYLDREGAGPAARCPLKAAQRLRQAAIQTWQARLHKVTVDADAPLAHALRDAIRTAHAHLLISADGPWLRPGTRSYARSWIRDGAMMSAGLLRLGETQAPVDYLDAWAPIQYTSGKVPCCHDARGADPVPENDSAGEFLFLAGQVLQYGGADGRRHVAAVYPQLMKAVAYLDHQRAETQAPGQSVDYAGLLPVSISHEGYSAKPMHAYWDDFWGLRGYADAVTIARALDHPEDAARIATAREQFSLAVRTTLQRSMASHAIDYLPGAADLGDFDPTSTTIALAPGTGGDDVPMAALQRTFERYWTFFTDRRDGRLAWDNYTPYEWRNVGALVRLHERERAFAAFEWFFDARRPKPWHQWTEVVTRDQVTPRFIGDLPHGWVASDFLRSALDLYAYDDAVTGTVVLGAGLPSAWLNGRGVTVEHLVTPWGRLSYRARHRAGTIAVTLTETPNAPGGLVLDFPGVRADAIATVDGAPLPTYHGRLTLRQPAHHILIASD